MKSTVQLTKNITIISFGHLNPQGAGGGIISWYLAKELNELKYLDKLIILSKGRYNPNFICHESIPFGKYYLFIFSRLIKWLKIPDHIFRGLNERLFDFFSQRFISHKNNILLLTHPIIPGTLKKAKRMGIKTILIAPNPFDFCIEKMILEEEKKFGIHARDGYTSDFRLKQMERSFPKFDYIISATSSIKETYTKYGYSEKIIDLNFPAGPNFEMFKFKEDVDKKDNIFRVCYISHTVLLKGLQYLLEAWQDINLEDIELIVGSGIDRNVKKIINERFSDLRNVDYAGHIKDLNSFYKSSSVFVCPSLIDGGPRTVYEAMACGLPVIVTEGCGAKDIIENGKEGFIVPIRDAEAIKEKIIWFYEHPKEREQMGLNAKEKIKNYTIEKFAEKVIEAICKIKVENV